MLISDILRRDSPDYEAVLETVGQDKHDLEAISLEAGRAIARWKCWASYRAADVLRGCSGYQRPHEQIHRHERAPRSA